jgi:hypothetical protein
MKNLSNTRPEESVESSYLIEQDQSSTTSPRGIERVLQLWYRLTSPPEPAASAPFKERERFRRGRTGSQIALFLFIMSIPAYQAGFAGGNHLLIYYVTIANVILALAMVLLNRTGKVAAAGTIVVLVFMASPMINIVTTPGGVNTSALLNFAILVLPLMCAVSFLSPGWVFVVAVGNCLFAIIDLLFLPSSGELHEILKAGAPGIIVPIFLSQGIVAVVAFLWVRGAIQALLRADRAEVIARLEHDLALQAEAVAEQKQKLDASIQKIVETHVRVANGDFNARVPLTQDNVLWQISGSLNNLLGRLQRWRQDASRVQQLQFALQQSREEIARLNRIIEESKR